MKPILLLATAVSTAVVSVGACLAQDTPAIWDLDRINNKVERIAAGEKMDFYDQLKAQADSLLAVELNPSVTHKAKMAVSGNKNDYMSLSRYTWPDPDSPDGLPYIFLDGQSNPELEEYDRNVLGSFASSVETLAIVYYVSGEQKYADKAISRLRTWFTDPQTLMNPNFEYGQVHKGYSNDNGAPAGILDGLSFLTMLDALALLDIRGAIPQDLNDGIKAWFSDLTEWLVTSENGIAESNVKHNHSIAYDDQVVRFAMYSGREDIARRVIEEFPARRIDVQFRADGTMPAELARTRAFGYSRYNVEHIVDLCDMAEKLGIHDLYPARDNATDRAIEWLTPYAKDTASFPYQQILDWTSTVHTYARTIYRASKFSEKGDEYKAFYREYGAGEHERALFEFMYLD